MSDHKKCPSSEKEHEKCIFILSYFHRIEPRYCVISTTYLLQFCIFVVKFLILFGRVCERLLYPVMVASGVSQERTIINNFTPTLHTRHRQPAMDGWFSVAHLFVSSYNKLSPFNCSISTSV